MSLIRIHCIACGTELEIPDVVIGKMTKCSACNVIFRAQTTPQKVELPPAAPESPLTLPSNTRPTAAQPTVVQPTVAALSPHEGGTSVLNVILYIIMFGAILAVFGGIGYGFYTNWDFLRSRGFFTVKPTEEPAQFETKPTETEPLVVNPPEPDKKIDTDKENDPVVLPPNLPQITPTASDAKVDANGRIIVIISGEEDCDLWFTTDGQDPALNRGGTSKAGSISVPVTPGTTVKAIATRAGRQSGVTEVYYEERKQQPQTTTTTGISPDTEEQIIKELQERERTNPGIKNHTAHYQMARAAANGHIEVMKWLATNWGTDIKGEYSAEQNVWGISQVDGGATLLGIAAMKGQVKAMEWLVEKGLYYDMRDKKGRTPLFVAAENGQIDAMEWLVQQGAEVRIKDDRGRTPMLAAGGNGQFKAVEWLRARGGEIGITADVAYFMMHDAVKGKRIETVKWFIEQGINVNVNIGPFGGTTYVYEAVSNGDLAMVKLLKANGADLNRSSMMATYSLEVAARANNFEMVKWLINNGINFKPEDYNLRCLMGEAAKKGDTEMIDLLLQNGANINWDVTSLYATRAGQGKTLLRLAEEASQVEMIKWLKSRGGKSESEPVPSNSGTHRITQPSDVTPTPPPPDVTKPQPKAITWNISSDWNLENVDNTNARFGKFCDQVRRKGDTYVGVNIGDPAKDRNDDVYKSYLAAIIRNCESIAPRDATAMKITDNALVNNNRYDRYEVKASGSDKKITVFIGVENDRCVAYWFFPASSDVAQGIVGKATLR